MTETPGDPHAIGSSFEATDDYQAPPREPERNELEIDPPPQPHGDGAVDINLLESQRHGSAPRTSKPIVADLSKKSYTISGPDEASEPGQPDAAPPGETM